MCLRASVEPYVVAVRFDPIDVGNCDEETSSVLVDQEALRPARPVCRRHTRRRQIAALFSQKLDQPLVSLDRTFDRQLPSRALHRDAKPLGLHRLDDVVQRVDVETPRSRARRTPSRR
jgi:hypothetical protein